MAEGGINPKTGLPKRNMRVRLFDGGEPVNIGGRVANLQNGSHSANVSAQERAVLERAEVTVTPEGKIVGRISLQQRRDRNAAALRVAFELDGWETLGTVTYGGINPDTGLPRRDTEVKLSTNDLVNAGARLNDITRGGKHSRKVSPEEIAVLKEAGVTRNAEGKLVRMGEAVGGRSAVHASGSASGVVPTYAAQPPAAAAGPSRPWPPSSGPAPAQPSGSAYPYGAAPFPAPAYPYPPVQTPAWPAAQQTASAQDQWLEQLAGIPTRSVPAPAQAQTQTQAWQWDQQLAQIPTRSVPDPAQAQQSATAPGQPGAAWDAAYDPAAWPGTPYNPTTAQAAAHTVPGAPPAQQLPRLNTPTPHQTSPHTHPTPRKPQQPHPGR
ncbi:hypothetical protein [Streptomyces bauhiniae]